MGAAVDDGQALAVVGRPIEPGDPAPDFSLDLFTRMHHGAGRVAHAQYVTDQSHEPDDDAAAASG